MGLDLDDTGDLPSLRTQKWNARWDLFDFFVPRKNQEIRQDVELLFDCAVVVGAEDGHVEATITIDDGLEEYHMLQAWDEKMEQGPSKEIQNLAQNFLNGGMVFAPAFFCTTPTSLILFCWNAGVSEVIYRLDKLATRLEHPDLCDANVQMTVAIREIHICRKRI